MTNQEIINLSIIEGNILKLPTIQLDRKQYLEISKSLELIGGKWKSNKKGFEFQIINRVILDILFQTSNIQKEYQYFATPDSLCDKLVNMAELSINNTVLEPSAGQGSIIKAIHRKISINVDCYELMEINRNFLDFPNVNLVGDDFLLDNGKRYDRIIANPPFSKNRDIIHILEMYNRLNNNGILVSLASKHWLFSSNKKETEFRNWLGQVNAYTEDEPKNTFKDTPIETIIIKICKD